MTDPQHGVPGVHLDAGLVRRQLRAIDPKLEELPLRYLATGWDNVVYRLGERLVVRVPRHARADRLAAVERRWLPQLARHSGLDLPVPLHVGTPDENYPWSLSVCRYLAGRSALQLARRRRDEYADQLAEYLHALHCPAPGQAPRSALRGVPLAELDPDVRARLQALPAPQRAAAARIWRQALQAAPHRGPDVWLHGDPHPHNTIVRVQDNGTVRLAGLVDFGDMCAGDPAGDLGMLWLHFTADARQRALDRLGAPCGGPRWQRARGWALRYCLVLHDAAPGGALARLGRQSLAVLLREDEPDVPR